MFNVTEERMSKVKLENKKFTNMTWGERSACIGLHGDYKVLNVSWYDKDVYRVHYQNASGKADYVLAETLGKALSEMKKKG